MKKSLGCKDLGVKNCTFEARSENKAEIIDALNNHASKYHPEKLSNLSEKEKSDMVQQMEKMIK